MNQSYTEEYGCNFTSIVPQTSTVLKITSASITNWSTILEKLEKPEQATFLLIKYNEDDISGRSNSSAPLLFISPIQRAVRV